MRLDPTSETGPISMVISELEPDTILINEVDRATERIVMTSSLSLVTDYTADNTVLQLIQVSHELAAVPGTAADDKNNNNNSNTKPIIEGHQVWRFRRKDAYQ